MSTDSADAIEIIGALSGWFAGFTAIGVAGFTAIGVAVYAGLKVKEQIKEAKHSNDFQTELRIRRQIVILERQRQFTIDVSSLCSVSSNKPIHESIWLRMGTYVINFKVVSAHLNELDQVIETMSAHEYLIHHNYIKSVRSYVATLGAILGGNPEGTYEPKLYVDGDAIKRFTNGLEAFTEVMAERETPDKIESEYNEMIKGNILYLYTQLPQKPEYFSK